MGVGLRGTEDGPGRKPMRLPTIQPTQPHPTTQEEENTVAKLPKDVAQQTKDAEDGFKLMEEGDYEVELIEVQTEKNGKPTVGAQSGVPYWTWVFQIPEDADRYKKRRFWRIISLGETSAPIRKSAFNAFGADPETTDTDDLIGRKCLAHIGTKMNEQGARAGTEDNEIQRLMPLDAPAGKAKGKGDTAKPDMF